MATLEEVMDLTGERVFGYKLRREGVIFPSIPYFLKSRGDLGLLVNLTKASICFYPNGVVVSNSSVLNNYLSHYLKCIFMSHFLRDCYLSPRTTLKKKLC